MVTVPLLESQYWMLCDEAPKCSPDSALLSYDMLSPHLDVEVTGAHIKYTASHIQGSAGPSGTDCNHWQDVLLRYGAHSDCLRDSTAVLVRRLCNTVIPWDDIRALLACRMVALDKCPGVRRIGVRGNSKEDFRQDCSVMRCDLEDVCGTSQLCGGVRSGIEGDVHTIFDLVNEHNDDGWSVFLIDASNAFNSINRRAALWNSRVLWPNCSLFLFNCYRGWTPIVFTDSAEVLYSKEGVTQGDPLLMFIYAVATIPMINGIGRPTNGTDVWYADDASACAPLCDLKDWFFKLLHVGPSYGYYPEPQKCVLVVNSTHFDTASQLFSGFGVEVTTSHRLLGGVIGDQDGRTTFIELCEGLDTDC